MPQWDPGRYRRFATQRARPLADLVQHVDAPHASTVLDLGCGPGTDAAVLRRAWPSADLLGVDSSPAMVARARAEDPDGRYEVADLRTWSPSQPVDVLVSNAALQWVPGHLELLPGLLQHVAPGGWLALQVPGNLHEPSHVLRRELAAQPPYAKHLTVLEQPASHDPAAYLEVLAGEGCSVDTWETTYLHVLDGPDAVLQWVSGTSLRPTLQALPEPLREQFTDALRARLREAYPEGPHGVLLPFRRVFAVARCPR